MGRTLKIRRGLVQIDAELSDEELDGALAEHFGIDFKA